VNFEKLISLNLYPNSEIASEIKGEIFCLILQCYPVLGGKNKKQFKKGERNGKK
jgi:hypothetical protein